MPNLTLERRLVRPLGRPRPEPGHHVVVYREAGEGKTYYQTLARGEAFRPPLFDRLLGSFVGYAVQAGEGLRHHFSEQLETGTGDQHDYFTIHVTLLYRVAAPEAVVERVGEDPLGSLEKDIRTVFQRRAAELTYAELIDPKLDLEGFLLLGGQRAEAAGAPTALARFQALAQEFGLELERVELTRQFSSGKRGADHGVVTAIYTSRVEVAKVLGEHEVARSRLQSKNELSELGAHGDRIRAGTRRQIEVLDAVAGGLQQILGNVAQDTRTVAEVRTLFSELSRAREELDSLALPAATVVRAHRALSAGEYDGALGSELQRMIEVTSGLELAPSDRAVLEGRLLRVVAEIRLGGAGSEALARLVADLRRHSQEIELEAAISTEEQRRYLARFRDPETIRREFAALAALPQVAGAEIS